MNVLHRQDWGIIIIILLVCWRFLHFDAALDLPHDWRQADTAYYIWDFYQNGIDLLHPAVCWMGGADTVILEFPLPEAIVAQFQRWVGESIFLSRLLFLLFFLLCCYYFYRVVHFLLGREMALWALIIYLSLPLAQFYSRAIHIDFFAQGFAYAVFYYSLLGIERRAIKFLLLASILSSVAFLVKAPYTFYLAFPTLWYAYKRGAIPWLLVRSVVFLPSILLFLAWQKHVYAVNGSAPDWNYILHYRKFDHNASWYFGVLEQRFSLYHWKEIGLRLLLEASGVFALLFFPLRWLRKKDTPQQTLVAWGLGLSVYLLLFFNLNAIHNYYQIPFLGFIALLIAAGLRSRIDQHKVPFSFVVLPLLVVLNTAYAEWKYYQVPQGLDEIAMTIKSHTKPTDLPIVVYQNFDCRNPRILGRAKRRGWSLQEEAATPQVIKRLFREEGATHLFVIDNTKLGEELEQSFSRWKLREIEPGTTETAKLSIQYFEMP